MITYKQALAPQTLIAGDVLAYTVPTGTIAQIRATTLHNQSVDVVIAKVYVVPSAGIVGDAYKLVSKSLAAGQSYLCPEIINHVLKAGDKVYISGANANAMMSVMEQVA